MICLEILGFLGYDVCLDSSAIAGWLELWYGLGATGRETVTWHVTAERWQEKSEGAGWKAEDRFYSVVVWGEGNFSEAGSCEQVDEESRNMMRKKQDRDT